MNKCQMELGFLFPGGELIKIEDWEQYYAENKEIIGDVYDFIKKSEAGLIIECEGSQNFLSFTDIKPEPLTSKERRDAIHKTAKESAMPFSSQIERDIKAFRAEQKAK